jgi:uncharacterized membrane protein
MATAVSPPGTREAPARPERKRRFVDSVKRHPWVLVSIGVVLAAIAFVLLTGMRPEYDAWGFLVWGKQALHWNLSTRAAPSWKPLPFLFTLPYALTGGAQLWLWMITAVAAALAGAPIAGRIAYRLVGPSSERPYAPWVAAVFAGVGVLGLFNYGHYLLIANSDPMEVTVCLAAIDSHLCGRRRLAWLFLVLASLGRPEAWSVTGVYALWAWRAEPSMRPMIGASVIAIPAMWFGIGRLTSDSWTVASDVARGSRSPLPGFKLAAVIRHWRDLYQVPMQLAALASVVIAVLRRDRATLVLTGAALLWVVVEIVMAYRGWNAPSRYLFAPAAVMVVVAGVGVGRVLQATPSSPLLRVAFPAVVLALVVALVPAGRTWERLFHNKVSTERLWRTKIDHLHALLARQGATRIFACGFPVSYLGYQPVIAWYIGKNVSDIGWNPTDSINSGAPIVLYRLADPNDSRWVAQPLHIPPSQRPACNRLLAAS